MRRSLFPASTRVRVGRLQTIANVIAGGIELVKFGIEAWRTRKNPKRAREIFDANPSELEAIRDAAGRSMVGDEASSFGPRREDTP